MTKRELNILHLYPKEMNLYGDHGNVLTLARRCEWRDITTHVIPYEPGDKFPKNVDIIFGGGGQDSGQSKIQDDLLIVAPKILKLLNENTPCLVVCGLYQLFGKFFKTLDGITIKGIGFFDIETYGHDERLIGNIVEQSELFGEIVGYENHSGVTIINGEKPLGKVIRGAGNDSTGRHEGAIKLNTIGTYLHGPILPKNPQIADFLISTALQNKYGDSSIIGLDDRTETLAHSSARSRPR